MYKKSLIFSAMAILALSTGACDENTTSSETTEKSVVDGTTVESTTSRETTIKDNGDLTEKVQRKTTVDPEGLMNKTTTEEERSTQESSE